MAENFNSAESLLDMNPNDLSVFNEPESQASNVNPFVYKPMPKDSKSDDGVYRSRIKIIYNPFSTKDSIITKQSYALQDEDGFFIADSKLTLNDKNCPIFKAWKVLRYSDDPAKNALIQRVEGKTPLFDKRFSRWCLIQILEDDNQPELNGQFRFFKLPKAIWEVLDAKMNPAPESKKKPLAIMDYVIGRALDLEVKPGPKDPANPQRETREISYGTSEFTEETYPIYTLDGKPFVTDAEVETVKAYYKARVDVMKAADRQAAMAQFKTTQVYADALAVYNRCIEYLKENCPDLVKEMGYQEWSPELTERVQKWIDRVLAGNIPQPKAREDAGTTAAPAYPGAETASAAPAMPTAEEDPDDLPF